MPLPRRPPGAEVTILNSFYMVSLLFMWIIIPYLGSVALIPGIMQGKCHTYMQMDGGVVNQGWGCDARCRVAFKLEEAGTHDYSMPPCRPSARLW